MSSSSKRRLPDATKNGRNGDAYCHSNFLETYDYFGAAAVPVGDLDGDGIGDLAVGAPGDDIDDIGAIYLLFLDSDSTIKESRRIGDGLFGLEGGNIFTDSAFGTSIALLGDLDGDGHPELAVGAPLAPQDSTSGAQEGQVFILFLDSTGSGVANIDIKAAKRLGAYAESLLGSANPPLDGRFGHSVANIGDLDGDGVVDLAVGSPTHGGEGGGAVWILFLRSDGEVRSFVRMMGPALAPANGEAQCCYYDWVQRSFGMSVVAVGDVDGTPARLEPAARAAARSPRHLVTIRAARLPLEQVTM